MANIPYDYTCQISNKIMNNPVIMENGNTFEQSAVQNLIDNYPKSRITGLFQCPISRDIISTRQIRNKAIFSLIKKFRDAEAKEQWDTNNAKGNLYLTNICEVLTNKKK